MAADSKQTDLLREGEFSWVSKLHKQDSVYFTFSGFAHALDEDKFELDVEQHLRKKLLAMPLTDSAFGALDKYISVQFGMEHGVKFRNRPTSFQVSPYVIEIAFVYLLNDAINVRYSKIRPFSFSKPRVFRGDFPPLFFGYVDSLRAVYNRNPKLAETIGIVETINHLISAQIIASPEYVGGPIDILRVTKGGHKWIQGKPQSISNF